jgi:hypothetical protein
MPAWILDDQPRPIGKHDVCATYGQVANVLTHALLCDEDVNSARLVTKATANVRCIHMGPPLRPQSKDIDVFGSAELSTGERLQIKAFVDDRLLERKSQKKRLQLLGERLKTEDEYVICPAFLPPSPSQPLWRFNCAGFVLQAYLEADITLLDESVPVVDMNRLIEAYPWAEDQLSDSETRRKMGVGEGEEWPVVFVGYVIHSLSRSSVEIRAQPYVAKEADIQYSVGNGDRTGGGKGKPGKDKM